MTRRAETGVGSGFLGVASDETGAMKSRESHVVESQLRREGRDRTHTMAPGARAFAVTARAQVARARRAHAVLAHEITLVDEMVGRRRPFRSQVHMTAVAIAQSPLVAVLVTPETGRHFGQDRFRIAFGDLDVASHAVAMGCEHVLAMLESQVLARQFDTLANVRLSVAPAACSLVVRLDVAAAASCFRRKAHRPGCRSRDGRVASHAVDAAEHVRPVLEWMRGRRALQSEQARARRERERQDH
jgi:hypothetical protein